MTLSHSADFFDSFVARTREAVPDGELAHTWSCEALARGWRQSGLRPGDLVLLCMPNGKELLHQFFGVLVAEGVPALLAPGTPAARLRDMCQAMGARAVGALRFPGDDLGAQAHRTIGRLQVAMLPPTPKPAAKPGEVVLLTSGTSGFASGCVFDFDALLLNGQRHADAIGQRADDVVLVNLPMYFSFALVAQALASLTRGNRLVISGPPFSNAHYRKMLEDHEISISSLTPALVGSVLQSQASFLSLPRVLTIGGDALAPELVARLVHLRECRELYLTYGLTQAGPRVATFAAHAEPPRRYASAGLPMEGTTVCLRPTADDSGLNQLYVASATVMKRSIGRIEGRAQAGLTAPQTIATGDIFEQDQEGYLYFRGRLSDCIIRQGEKVSLAGVRRVASQLPHVVSARTVVIRHEDGSQDFDLELSVDSPAGERIDARKTLRSLLKRTELPRRIHIQTSNEAGIHAYK
jgi:acyl-CoA synthetase (AMP-forming)/AMP-acid ligase II